MPAGAYAVVRYIPDPARDEPINIGIIATGPAGACFRTHTAALDRMRVVDPMLDPDTVAYVPTYVEQLVEKPVIRFIDGGVEVVEPWHAQFLDALRGQLPERFTLGRSLYVEYADESREAMEAAAIDLVDRLVKPSTRKPRFVVDPGAPFEQLKKLLKPAISSGAVMERPPIQGATRRIRQPEFYYTDRQGTVVFIIMVKLTQTRRHNLSVTADAKAFELYDLLRSKQEASIPARAVVVLEQPEKPTEDFIEARKSLEWVRCEIIDPREGVDELARRVEQEALAVAR